jgi:putative two-component system response regulator
MVILRDSAGSHFEPRLVQLFESILPSILAIKADWDLKYHEPTRTA